MSATILALALIQIASEAGDRDKLLAPPPLEVDGLVGQPIDVLGLRARIHFDRRERSAACRAELLFEMAREAGFPVFDLRQEIASAELDEEPIDPTDLAAHEVGPRTGSLRILERELAPGKVHRLVLEYPLGTPASPGARGIRWTEDGGLGWDLWFSDLSPGRYLEMWLPANLIHDRFPLELEIELDHLEGDHELVTNAAVRRLGRHHWKLAFPPTTTAFSPMIVIVPATEVERAASRVRIGGRSIRIDVCRRLEAGGDLDRVTAQVARDLQEFERRIGPWPHGDRVTVYLWRGGRSMEYDGATTSSLGALRHELFHSWWGRGVKPASQNDGWIDEAWDTWQADGESPPVPPGTGPPVQLCPADPWNRVTDHRSYGAGAAFFSRLAGLLGREELEARMAAFFRARVHEPVTTAELECHLAAGDHEEEVRALFERYVYGRG